LTPGRLDRARASLKPRPRAPRPPTAPPPVQSLAAPPSAAPVPRELLDRRDRLQAEYAELQSDLGGLVYEMAIRDAYRLDVITRRAAKLQAADAQLSEVERLLAAITQPAPAPAPAPATPAPAPAAPAAAPPPIAPTSTPAAAAPALTCPACSRPLEPGAAFCGSCGASLGSVPPPPPGQAFAGQ
jgi:hypothetical protein